ncbi:MAG: hypothetical protein MI717_06310 [Spirochaetales bacterium]|nr:hypothetical protein [Spirochaetales bacterium]
MKPEMLIETINAQAVYLAPGWEELDICTGCSSDLMSDILTLDVCDAVLVTGLANEQAVRTADMADIRTILLVRSKAPTAGMLNLAKDCGISLLTTKLSMFSVCGHLMKAGLKPPY